MLSDRRSHDALTDLEVRSQFRRRAGLTLFALAQRVGKSAGTLSQWERGQINLSTPDIERIARALGEELARFPASLSVAQIVDLLSDAVSLNVDEPNKGTHEG
jgi:transcriptional regulator with XRE-family HTH domain